jgi:hypothetical protein
MEKNIMAQARKFKITASKLDEIKAILDSKPEKEKIYRDQECIEALRPNILALHQKYYEVEEITEFISELTMAKISRVQITKIINEPILEAQTPRSRKPRKFRKTPLEKKDVWPNSPDEYLPEEESTSETASISDLLVSDNNSENNQVGKDKIEENNSEILSENFVNLKPSLSENIEDINDLEHKQSD